MGGHYLPDDAMAEKAMRPSLTSNAVIDSLGTDGYDSLLNALVAG